MRADLFPIGQAQQLPFSSSCLVRPSQHLSSKHLSCGPAQVTQADCSSITTPAPGPFLLPTCMARRGHFPHAKAAQALITFCSLAVAPRWRHIAHLTAHGILQQPVHMPSSISFFFIIPSMSPGAMHLFFLARWLPRQLNTHASWQSTPTPQLWSVSLRVPRRSLRRLCMHVSFMQMGIFHSFPSLVYFPVKLAR